MDDHHQPLRAQTDFVQLVSIGGHFGGLDKKGMLV